MLLGPTYPWDMLGVQGNTLEARQKLVNKDYLFCENKGFRTLKNLTKRGNLESNSNFKLWSSKRGKLGKEMKDLKRGA